VIDTSKNRAILIAVSWAIGLFVPWMTLGCSQDSGNSVASEMECQQYASSRTGYQPAKPDSGSSVGKGAAIGAVGGAAVGAATSKKSKKVVQGAAVGAAAGAGAGALKDNEDKKKTEAAAAAYRTEYQNCMNNKAN